MIKGGRANHIDQMNTHKNKNDKIAEAINLARDIYESIDSRELKGGGRIKVRAIGQCLRLIKDELPIESNDNQRAAE
jgi:hypothetical protein